MLLRYTMGQIAPYFALFKEGLFRAYGPQYRPKRTKLKGYQKCKKKRR
jgi:hypothetical protein